MRSFSSCGTSLYWLQTRLLSPAYILVAGHGDVMFVRVPQGGRGEEADFSTASKNVLFFLIFILSVRGLFRLLAAQTISCSLLYCCKVWWKTEMYIMCKFIHLAVFVVRKGTVWGLFTDSWQTYLHSLSQQTVLSYEIADLSAAHLHISEFLGFVKNVTFVKEGKLCWIQFIRKMAILIYCTKT